MILFHRVLGESEQPKLVILHGLFGSGDNWQTHAKFLSQWFQVFLIDQRNHGHSEHAERMDYEAMTDDFYETLEHLKLSQIHLMGHSMGGKTAMNFALQYPERILSLMVIDMGIKAYPRHHDIIFQGLHAVDVEHCASRKEAENRIQPFIPDLSTQQFLLKSLYWIEEGKLAWRFNVPVLEKNIENILKSITHFLPFEGRTLFLTGGKSSYVLPSDYSEIQILFPQVQFEVIDNAGHWVHAEAPQAFLNSITSFLNIDKPHN